MTRIPCRDRGEAFAVARQLREEGFAAAVSVYRGAGGPAPAAVEIEPGVSRLIVRAVLADVRAGGDP